MASRRSRSQTGLVVVCCAQDDVSTLEKALAPLRDDGHQVELVPGVDQNPKNVGEVIDRFEGEGLYVLCRSPQLGRDKVEELRELLLSRQIPFARTLTIAVGGRGALADRIRSGLRRASNRGGGGLGRGKSARTTRSLTSKSSTPAVTSSTPTTPRVTSSTPTTPAAEPTTIPKPSAQPLVPASETEDDEPTLVGLKEPGLPDAIANAISGPITNPSMPLPVPAVDSAPITAPARALPAEEPPLEPDEEPTNAGPPPVPPASTTSADEVGLSTTGSMSRLDLSDLDDTIPPQPNSPDPVDSTAPGTPPAFITGNTVVGPAPALITGNTVVGKRLSDIKAASELVATSSPLPGINDLEPTTAPFSPVRSGSTIPASKPPPSIPSGPPPPAGAVPSAVSDSPSSAVGPVGPLDQGAPGTMAPIGPGAGAPSAMSPAMAPSGPIATAPPRSPLPLILGSLAAAVLLIVGTIALWPGDDEDDEVAKKAEQERAEQEKAAQDAKAKAEAEAEPEPEAAPEPEPDVFPVVEALEARRVRALDVLLIATDTSKPSDFPSAASYCEQLDIDGLRGWRLPQVGELRSLSQANMIARRGYFWSATAADTFGDDHLAWNVRRSYAQKYSKNAVAVCVRGGISGS